jgi:hypothetical protein
LSGGVVLQGLTKMPTKKTGGSQNGHAAICEMLLEHLIDMADQYSLSGSPRQAIELYFELVIEHAGTEQSVQACERLLAVARQYKNNGELRQARGIYERLLKAS